MGLLGEQNTRPPSCTTPPQLTIFNERKKEGKKDTERKVENDKKRKRHKEKEKNRIEKGRKKENVKKES